MPTYSSGYVSSLKAAKGFVFRIKYFKEIETKRHVAEELNPQHHRLRRSDLSALHQFEHTVRDILCAELNSQWHRVAV